MNITFYSFYTRETQHFNIQIQEANIVNFQHTHAQNNLVNILFWKIFLIPYMTSEYTFNTLSQPDLKLSTRRHKNTCFESFKGSNDRGMKRGPH